MEMRRLQNNKYFFSVEGETEELYFKHLKKLILAEEGRIANPVFVIQKDSPAKVAKKLPMILPCTITAVFDVEDADAEHCKRFENTLKEMSEAEKLGKAIKFDLGYSNIDFELWIILHKKDLFGNVGSKAQYLKNINQVYGTKFEALREYKTERNFSQILSKITLDDVKAAIARAEKITKQRMSEGNPIRTCGYEWFDKNPALSVHCVIKKILSECGV